MRRTSALWIASLFVVVGCAVGCAGEVANNGSGSGGATTGGSGGSSGTAGANGGGGSGPGAGGATSGQGGSTGSTGGVTGTAGSGAGGARTGAGGGTTSTGGATGAGGAPGWAACPAPATRARPRPPGRPPVPPRRRPLAWPARGRRSAPTPATPTPRWSPSRRTSRSTPTGRSPRRRARRRPTSSRTSIWPNLFGSPIFFPEPYCNSTTKSKASVVVKTTFGLTGGGFGNGFMGMWIGPGATADHWGLAHEFMHSVQSTTRGLQCQGPPSTQAYCGWIYESHANWRAQQLPEYHQTTFTARRCWSTRPTSTWARRAIVTATGSSWSFSRTSIATRRSTISGPRRRPATIRSPTS